MFLDGKKISLNHFITVKNDDALHIPDPSFPMLKEEKGRGKKIPSRLKMQEKEEPPLTTARKERGNIIISLHVEKPPR